MEKKYVCPNCGQVEFSAIPAESYECVDDLCSTCKENRAEFFIKHPQKNIEEPAWKHADGTLISFWDSLPELLIQDDDGARLISHDTAKELGYNN